MTSMKSTVNSNAKRRNATTTIGGVTVRLVPVRGKGNLSSSKIQEMVRWMKQHGSEAGAGA